MNPRRLLAAFNAWRGDQRTRNDRAMAGWIARFLPTPERQQPGTDNDALFDALLAYYGPAGLDRLRNDIHQPRKEDR